MYITEKQASELTGYKPRTLRKKVVSGFFRVDYRTIGGRKFQYKKADLEKIFITVKQTA